MPAALSSLDIKLAVSSGIPELATATINAWRTGRETMDGDIQRRWDLLGIWTAEQFWGLFGYKPPEGGKP